MSEIVKPAPAQPVSVTHEFVSLGVPRDWDGQRTVSVMLEDGDEMMATVAAPVRGVVRRAAALQQAGLCSRIDLTMDASGLQVVGALWEP